MYKHEIYFFQITFYEKDYHVAHKGLLLFVDSAEIPCPAQIKLQIVNFLSPNIKLYGRYQNFIYTLFPRAKDISYK